MTNGTAPNPDRPPVLAKNGVRRDAASQYKSTNETAMLLIRWILTALFAVFAVFLDTANLAVPFLAHKRGRHMSPVPLFGAVAGTAACLLCPVVGSAKVIPVAILLDVSAVGLAVWVVRAVAVRNKAPR